MIRCQHSMSLRHLGCLLLAILALGAVVYLWRCASLLFTEGGSSRAGEYGR